MASLTKGIFIVAAKRSPFGASGGRLVDKTAVDLQEIAGRAAIKSANINPEIIDSVCIGNVRSHSSPDGPYVGRHVLLRLGIPVSHPGYSVNRLCGSGFQSIICGAQEITMGQSKVTLAGGTENMSQTPLIIRNIRNGIKLGSDTKIEDVTGGSVDLYCNFSMGETAENVAEKYSISREEAEKFSVISQARWKEANEKGYFQEELAPVTLKVKGKDVEMTVDEHPRPNTTMEILAKLKPVFRKGGTVTAGTACGVCDGSGAVILASEEACREHNLKPLARLVGYGIAGVDPSYMGIGPVPSIQKLLKITQKSLDDIDLYEINEAFAPQTLACQQQLKIDHSKLNVNGGAIAVGHPLGASGSRIISHLVHELRRRKAKYGVGSACIGGGQGIALMLESVL
jgi:acetyl-CoA acyltransferase 2